MKRRISTALLCISLAMSALPVNAKATSKDRGTVVSIIATIEYPDGSIKVHNMDTCTPGGFYKGIDAIIFGDESIKIYQAGYSALHPQHGDIVLKQWNKKANKDDPWLPTYILAKDSNTDFKSKDVEAFNSSASVFIPKAKKSTDASGIINEERLAPTLIASCGGHIHLE